jgi:hypothetical protein
MRWLTAAFALALMTASAHAQLGAIAPGSNVGQHVSNANEKSSPNDAAKAKANDKAYNAALQNLPNKQYDPWHGVR